VACRRPGNGAAFLDLVAALTGKPLAGDAWVEMLQEPTEALLASERADYDAAVAAGPRFPPGAEVDIGARFRHRCSGPRMRCLLEPLALRPPPALNP